MRAAVLVAAVALLGCQQGSSESEAATQKPQPVAADDDRAQETPPPDQAADLAPEEVVSEVERRRIMNFCVHNLRRTLRCFDDDAYWDTFMTHYYATSGGGQADPEQKQRAIGILKDDILTLQREERFVENCENMVSTHKLPTEEQMQRVEASYDKTCAEYASALGLMIFSQRVFHDPR